MAKFEVGNPGGPGRPKRQTEQEYLSVIMSECNLETWRKVVKGAVDAAKAGDCKAREWLARYLVGEPSTKAATPLNIVVWQLSGNDPVINALAQPEIAKLSPLAKLFDDGPTDEQFQAIKREVARRLELLDSE